MHEDNQNPDLNDGTNCANGRPSVSPLTGETAQEYATKKLVNSIVWGKWWNIPEGAEWCKHPDDLPPHLLEERIRQRQISKCRRLKIVSRVLAPVGLGLSALSIVFSISSFGAQLDQDFVASLALAIVATIVAFAATALSTAALTVAVKHIKMRVNPKNSTAIVAGIALAVAVGTLAFGVVRIVLWTISVA